MMLILSTLVCKILSAVVENYFVTKCTSLLSIAVE